MFLVNVPVSRAIYFVLLIVSSLVGVSACGQSDVPHADSLDRYRLMTLAFDSWQQSGAGKVQSINLVPQDGNPKAPGSAVKVSISPIYVVKLDETHAALLTDAMDVDAQGAPATCHACSNHLGIYIFTRDEKGWRLAERQDHVTDIGVEGSMGKTGIVQLASHGYVFFAEWGSCWQGFCGRWLDLIGIRPGNAAVLSRGIRTAADNNGAYEDCSNPSLEEITGSSELDERPHECFSVTGHWEVVGDHVKMRFKGIRRDLDSEGNPKPARLISSQASYGLRGGKLVLEAGENPIPGF